MKTATHCFRWSSHSAKICLFFLKLSLERRSSSQWLQLVSISITPFHTAREGWILYGGQADQIQLTCFLLFVPLGPILLHKSSYLRLLHRKHPTPPVPEPEAWWEFAGWDCRQHATQKLNQGMLAYANHVLHLPVHAGVLCCVTSLRANILLHMLYRNLCMRSWKTYATTYLFVFRVPQYPLGGLFGIVLLICRKYFDILY